MRRKTIKHGNRSLTTVTRARSDFFSSFCVFFPQNKYGKKKVKQKSLSVSVGILLKID